MLRPSRAPWPAAAQNGHSDAVLGPARTVPARHRLCRPRARRARRSHGRRATSLRFRGAQGRGRRKSGRARSSAARYPRAGAMRRLKLISRKGEGTFSEVFKAQNVVTGKIVAVKVMKGHFQDVAQVNNLREIQALRRLSPHPHIVTLEEVIYDKPTGRLALVFELMDATLLEVINHRRRPLSAAAVAMYMYQLLQALEHMHRRGIFHRDIKPENVLLRRAANNAHVLKVADFGSCRGIYSNQPYTEYISTRWYRSPEVLLTDGFYGAAMDMWAVGCVMFETVALFPLFPGANEADMIRRVHDVLGAPPPHLLERIKSSRAAQAIDWAAVQAKPGRGIARLLSEEAAAPASDHAADLRRCVDLISQMVVYDPEGRLPAQDALAHPFFEVLSERDKQCIDAVASATAPPDAPARPPEDPPHPAQPRAGAPKKSPTVARARHRRAPKQPHPDANSATPAKPRAAAAAAAAVAGGGAATAAVEAPASGAEAALARLQIGPAPARAKERRAQGRAGERQAPRRVSEAGAARGGVWRAEGGAARGAKAGGRQRALHVRRPKPRARGASPQLSLRSFPEVKPIKVSRTTAAAANATLRAAAKGVPEGGAEGAAARRVPVLRIRKRGSKLLPKIP